MAFALMLQKIPVLPRLSQLRGIIMQKQSFRAPMLEGPSHLRTILVWFATLLVAIEDGSGSAV